MFECDIPHKYDVMNLLAHFYQADALNVHSKLRRLSKNEKFRFRLLYYFFNGI